MRALTHSSYANDDPDAEDNETLEFLGDAILNFLVSENHFAYLARRLDLGAALRLSPGEERPGSSAPRGPAPRVHRRTPFFQPFNRDQE